MNLNLSHLGLLSCTAILPLNLAAQKNQERPNVIIIEADDLGFGDLSCYGAKQIRTPGMDRLAHEGLRFTDAHSTAATSTPSRYSLLTGMYPWSNKAAKILPGNAALIINTERITLPKLMQEAGYATGAVGKWHLGLGDGNVDWNQHVAPGAAEVGYDYSFIQAATNDRVPCIFIENGNGVNLDPQDPLYVSYRKNFAGEPTGKHNPELLRMHPSVGHGGSIVNGVPRIGFQTGGKSAQWKDEDMAELFLNKAKQFVQEHKDTPFFLYYGLHQPHVPRVPNERFIGKSGMGPRGDVILEADWCVAEFLKELDHLGLTENTLIFFTSDNGPVLDDGYADQAVELVGDHRPAGPYRGWKTTRYMGGTCIPFIVHWPAKVKPGVTDAFVCQMDILASMSELTGVKINDTTHSEETLKVFLGKKEKGRKEMIIEGMFNYGYRKGDWVLLPPANKKGKWELYNIKKDPGQRHNLAKKETKRVKKMVKRFEELTQATHKVTRSFDYHSLE